MISYLVELTIYWALFYLAYMLFFKNDTNFNLNRYYLLFSIIVGITLPFAHLFDFGFQLQSNEITEILLFPITVTAESDTSIAEELATNSWMGFKLIILNIYLFGACLMLARFIFSIQKIFQIRKAAAKLKLNGSVCFVSEKIKEPFSFLNEIYLNKDQYPDHKELQQIIDHENFHIKERHSIDRILIEIVQVLCWMSPLIYLIKKELQTIHEYAADAEVISKHDAKQYGQLLLRHIELEQQYALVNQFNYSPLKNRIVMMSRKKTKSIYKLKYLLVIPLFLSLFIYSSCKKDKSPNQELSQAVSNNEEVDTVIVFDPDKMQETTYYVKKDNNAIYKVVQEMPSFGSCSEDGLVDEELRKCSYKQLLSFIYKNIKYPAQARDNGTEGTVIVKFVVEKDGSISNSRIYKDLGDKCGEESLRVVNLMNELNMKWTPGKQLGKTVRVEFTLPVKYKLQ